MRNERFWRTARFRSVTRYAARVAIAGWAGIAAYERVVGRERARKPLGVLAIGVGAWLILASVFDRSSQVQINDGDWVDGTRIGRLFTAAVGAFFIFAGARSI